ncbi:TPA: hypothetical protein QIS59_003885 [Escherichia coli]|uniref:hypothetical protein n=1 Tax=Escherichia coli TaxID=562 RepID=UPI0012FFF185|nr:hypothetical protein [Escherichia coli]HEP0227491.1 hypothetical protein [Escherichia coli]
MNTISPEGRISARLWLLIVNFTHQLERGKRRSFALRFFIALLSCVSLLLVVPLQYRYGGALVPG